MVILKDFKAKIEGFEDFSKSHFSKNGENNSFYASDYHQISFRGQG